MLLSRYNVTLYVFVQIVTATLRILGGKLGVEVLPVHAGNDAQANALGAFSFAGTGIGAASKAFGLHLGYHPFDACLSLRLSLGKKRKLRDFGTDKKSGR